MEKNTFFLSSLAENSFADFVAVVEFQIVVTWIHVYVRFLFGWLKPFLPTVFIL